MQTAHVFATDTQFESYELVYLNAIVNGFSVIGSLSESQRQIFDQRSGIPFESFSVSIADALGKLMCRETRSTTALSGSDGSLREFSPQVVAMKYRDVSVPVLERVRYI